MLQKAGNKSFLAVVLALAMVITSMLPAGMAKAAGKVPAVSVKFTTEGTASNLKVLVIGKKYQLQYTLSPKKSTDKVTFTSNDEKKAVVTTDGTVTPKRSGAVTITAKTTSGKKRSVTYLVVTSNGTTSMQSRIAKLLAAPNLSRVAIRNLTSTGTFTIEAGDYSDKSLNVRTPEADVKNYGIFKDVLVTDVKNGTWYEFGKGNSFDIKDDDVKFNVDKGSVVNALNVLTEKAKVVIEAAGTVNELKVTGADTTLSVNAQKDADIKKLTLDQKTDLAITGDSAKVMVEVTKNAEGSKVTSSVPVEMSIGSKVEIVLEKGAEGSKLEKTSGDVKLKVENKTVEKIEIAVEGSTKTETVDSGKTSDTTTSGGGGGGSVTPPAPTPVWTDAAEALTGGNTVFTLPVDIQNVLEAKVKVTITSDPITVNLDVPVSGEQMTYLSNLLKDDADAVNRWMAMTDTTKYGIKVTGSSNSREKTVEYVGNDSLASALQGKKFKVVLSGDSNKLTITRVDGSVNSFDLSISGNRTLTISGDVRNMVTFSVKHN